MCGIAGGWWRQRPNDCRQRVADSLSAMRRRGPDDRGLELYDTAQGSVALAQVRLSIIDLSNGGHQPMSVSDGSLVIVFNGEIYNYKELREELRGLGNVFRSDSDTEVLLAAWRQWSRDCIPRLIGMFAFVVFDRVKHTLTCVRDAFGIKPFFYFRNADSFLFASELGGMQAILRQKGHLNWQKAYDYLVLGNYDTGPESFLAGVLHLEPGHLIELDIAAGRLSEPLRWWLPTLTERSDLSFRDAADLVRSSFLDNIRLQLRSDVPIGAALSGGIDSSAVVCAIRHVEPNLPIHTFSYIAKGHAISEEPWVDCVNAHVGAIAHKVTATSSELAADLDDMIRAQGEPFGSSSIYAQYRVFRLASECGIKVTLDGQGADEMLAGYVGYPGHRIRSLVDGGRLMEAWHFLNQWSRWPGRSRALGVKAALAELTPPVLYGLLRRLNGRMVPVPRWINASPLRERGVECAYPSVRSVDSQPGRRLSSELLRELTSRRLPSLLRHGDRNSMHFSIESRVPFLTPDFAQLLLTLPETYLISAEGETKHVFRAAMRGIVPDAILDRRDKIGFDTPEHAWLSAMQDTVREWLSVELGLPFLNRGVILEEIDAIFAGTRPFSWQVWRWINFVRWYACFLGEDLPRDVQATSSS